MKSCAICFDLDGTITKQEILPLISKSVGLFEEINLLTQITLKGLIPFQNSFKLRVKLLSALPISRVRSVVNTVILDDIIKDFIQSNKEDCYVVTGNLDVWIGELVKEQLGCAYYSSVGRHKDDQLLGLESILDKKDAIADLRLRYDNIITVGDSMNDCSMFEVADTGIAFGGVHNPVESLISLSNYVVYDSRSLVQLLNQKMLKK